MSTGSIRRPGEIADLKLMTRQKNDLVIVRSGVYDVLDVPYASSLVI